ncbi:hypothetical protein YC2023_052677 [Brassica napus]
MNFKFLINQGMFWHAVEVVVCIFSVAPSSGMNKPSFSFGSSSGLLNYGGKLIGEAPFRASQIRQDKTFPMNVTLTFPMNVTLTLMADRLLTDAARYLEIIQISLLFISFN